jgi:hypothetical protein
MEQRKAEAVKKQRQEKDWSRDRKEPRTGTGRIVEHVDLRERLERKETEALKGRDRKETGTGGWQKH